MSLVLIFSISDPIGFQFRVESNNVSAQQKALFVNDHCKAYNQNSISRRNMQHKHNTSDKLFLRPGEGRIYNCGTMTAVFKADENETSDKYSISEWWLEPNSDGPGPHQHEDNEEIFYGIEGVTSILAGDKWVNVEKGTFLRIPSKTIHDFANRTNEKSAVLNFFIPGGFERNMPSIVKWFEDNK